MSKYQSDRNRNTIHRQLFLYIITFVKHFYLKINFVCFLKIPPPPPPPPPQLFLSVSETNFTYKFLLREKQYLLLYSSFINYLLMNLKKNVIKI